MTWQEREAAQHADNLAWQERERIIAAAYKADNNSGRMVEGYSFYQAADPAGV
ncbi:MAG: hypothetical protein WC554_16050 [Clostridia bacterium]|jgi:hypothetical protein